MMIQNKRKIASILFVLISILSFAQELPPPGPTPPPGLSIDGSVLIGAFIALFYGVKKLLKSN